MNTRLPQLPKNLLPIATLAVGFTLIMLGFGEIFGLGIGLIAAGVLTVVLQMVIYSDGGNDGEDTP